MGVFVALEVAIIRRIGINDDSGSSSLLRQVDLDSAEIHSVANHHHLPGNADVHVLELLEILRAPVVDIDGVGGHITGGRRTMEGRQDAGIILVRIVIDMLARGPAHQDFSLVVGGLQKYFLGKVHPCLVRDDLGFESGGLELAFDVQGGVVVFFAGCDVRGSGERFEFLGPPWRWARQGNPGRFWPAG